jgi:uncharacterized repeat protein (TIGR01451 family)
MADLEYEPQARQPSSAGRGRRRAAALACVTGAGSAALAAGLLVFGATGALAQEAPPVVVERSGADQVRAGERFEYQLEVRNQSDVPLKDVRIDEFVPPGRDQQGQQPGQQPGRQQAGQQEQQQQGQPKSAQQGKQGQQDQQKAAGQQQDQQGQQDRQQAASQQQGQQNQQDRQQAAGQQQDQQGQQDRQQAASQQQGQPDRQQAAGQQQGQQGQQDREQPEYGISRTIPFLAPGESRTIEVSGVARQEGSLRSCVAIDYTPATCADIEVVKPDLSLACELIRPDAEVYQAGDLDPSTFYACDTIVLNCMVRNEGTGATRPARLNLDLPEGLQAAEGSQRQVQIDPIDPGQSREVRLNLTAQEAREYRLQPTLTTDAGEMTAEPISVRAIQPQLELAVQSPDRGYLNRPVNYTVNVRNTGDVPVPATRLTIDPPEGLENLSMSSENGAAEDGSYALGTLRPGESRSVSVTGDAMDPGTATLRAAADGYCVETNEKTTEVALQGVPALVLFAYDERDPVAVGERTTYDIKVRNQGTAAAEQLELSGQLAEQLSFVEGDGHTPVQGNGNSFELEPVARLEPGESAGWTVTVEGANPGYGRLDLELTSTAMPRAITEQEPTRVIEVE